LSGKGAESPAGWRASQNHKSSSPSSAIFIKARSKPILSRRLPESRSSRDGQASRKYDGYRECDLGSIPFVEQFLLIACQKPASQGQFDYPVALRHFDLMRLN
jgi:hypothetical protein